MIWYRNSLHWALKRLLFALTSVTSTKLYRKSDWSEFHQRLTWKCRCLCENGEFHTFTFDGLFSQNRLILKLAKSCIVNTKTKRGFLKHGLWIRRNRCVWLRILVLWPSGEITSLIKLQGKPSLFTLPHCTDPF
jgi:hypothetical protein